MKKRIFILVIIFSSLMQGNVKADTQTDGFMNADILYQLCTRYEERSEFEISCRSYLSGFRDSSAVTLTLFNKIKCKRLYRTKVETLKQDYISFYSSIVKEDSSVDKTPAALVFLTMVLQKYNC